jgi:hypothetical protein
MVDGPSTFLVNSNQPKPIYILLLAKNRGQSTNLGTQSRPNMLRGVRHQVLHSSHDVVEQSRSIHKFTEARDLSGNSSPDLRLGVLQKLHKSRYKVSCYDLIIYCFCDLQNVS